MNPAASRTGKPVDDMTLNKKYFKCVCDPCKMQIHEKLKRGYTKYKSLDKPKPWLVDASIDLFLAKFRIFHTYQ